MTSPTLAATRSLSRDYYKARRVSESAAVLRASFLPLTRCVLNQSHTRLPTRAGRAQGWWRATLMLCTAPVVFGVNIHSRNVTYKLREALSVGVTCTRTRSAERLGSDGDKRLTENVYPPK